jgi:hypothetical protein
MFANRPSARVMGIRSDDVHRAPAAVSGGSQWLSPGRLLDVGVARYRYWRPIAPWMFASTPSCAKITVPDG